MKIFKNLYAYRELLKSSIKKDIGGKYKNSFLGVLWSFVNPLLQIAVYAIIFPMIMRNNVPHYTLFLCSALIPWTFFSTAINRSSFTVIENGNIIKKVFFPREILPISLVTSEAINFIISTIIIVVFALFSGVGLSKYLLLYPLVLIIQYIFLIGISFIVSSITVFVRDLQHIIGVFMQLLFYATPIVYVASSIPSEYSWILKINFMTYIVEAYRSIFYYHNMPDLKVLTILFFIAILVCIIGYFIFSKLQKKFAEEL